MLSSVVMKLDDHQPPLAVQCYVPTIFIRHQPHQVTLTALEIWQCAQESL